MYAGLSAASPALLNFKLKLLGLGWCYGAGSMSQLEGLGRSDVTRTLEGRRLRLASESL